MVKIFRFKSLEAESLTGGAGTFTTLSAGLITATGNLVLTDNDGAQTATFDAQSKLTANRTYDLPDRSGLITLESQTFDFYYASAPSGATGGSGTWTWNIPSWSTHQLVVMIGAGGGGGSGRVGASGTACGGGGGGGAGAVITLHARITGGDQVEISVGAGGAGGAARGPAANNGFSGSAGTVTKVRWVSANVDLVPSAFFNPAPVGFGGGGGAGTLTAGSGGFGGQLTTTFFLGMGTQGGSGYSSSLTANATSGSANDSTQGGRAGGSISATPTAFNGGGLGTGTPFTVLAPELLLPTVSPQFGTAGIGGNASLTANGGDGGNAGQIGGGGGGGAAALVGFLSGAGGNGGNGFVRIICF